MIIDCVKIREKIIEELKQHNYEDYKAVFIQVGNNPASNIYVRNKIKLCEELGIAVFHVKLPQDSSEGELIETINLYNNLNPIDGIMVQLPLPKHINEMRVINTINPEKDIDGFTSINKGKLMVGDVTAIVPCTPKGIVTLLDEMEVNLVGKSVVVVGRSNIVGKPLANLLINRGATVIVCNSYTPKTVVKSHIYESDIFISAIGVPNYFNKDFFSVEQKKALKNALGLNPDFKIGKVAIDVGMNRDENDKLCGDISRDIYEYFDYVTPVPKGVGQMTVLEVVRNIIKCHELRGK